MFAGVVFDVPEPEGVRVATSELDAAIETAAGNPKSASGDGVSVTSHSIDELIKADKYLTAKRAKAGKWGGIKMQKLQPPGAVGDSDGSS